MIVALTAKHADAHGRLLDQFASVVRPGSEAHHPEYPNMVRRPSPHRGLELKTKGRHEPPPVLGASSVVVRGLPVTCNSERRSVGWKLLCCP